MSLVGVLLLCFLLTASAVGNGESLYPVERPQPRRFLRLQRTGRFFQARSAYYANTSATFQACRLRLSGDVQPNPGPPSERNITILTQNVRSVRNKLHTLRAAAPDLCRYDCIALTETWLTPDVADSELQHGLDQHTWFRRDRPTHGGGVACAIKTSLYPSRREEFETSCEVLVVQLGVALTSFIIVCYRPPDSDANIVPLLECFSRVSATGRPLLITGDFNLPELEWPRDGYPTFKKRSQRAISFLDGVNSCGLKQSVFYPTRGEVTLDLIFSRGGEADSTAQPGTFESDHCEIVSCFRLVASPTPKVSRSEAYNYRRADFDGLRAALRSIHWSVLRDMDVDSALGLFYDLVKAAIADHVPIVTRRGRFPPWFDAEVRHALRAKETAHRNNTTSPSPENYAVFSRARSFFKSVANSKYRAYLNSLVSDFRDNPKRFWTFIKSLKSSRHTPPILVTEGRTYSSSLERANLFNKVFASKFSNPHVSTIPNCPTFNIPNLSQFQVPRGKIETLLASIDKHKACGPDGLSARILSECSCELAVPLEILCQLSISQGVFPAVWKEANIIPVHKKGDKKNPNNYRGISLLPLCSKILEKVVFDCLLAHCRPALPPSQHGFLQKRSCLSNLSLFVQHCWDSIQEGAQTDAVYTDYSSAFPSVNHTLLLHKLKHSFNVTGLAHSWLESYLTHRRQRVVIEGKPSEWTPVVTGVPEGSIGGPLLFICFTADLPHLISTNCLMFADDIKLFHRIRSNSDAASLQRDLERLAAWSRAWHLKLNPQKCTTISFTLKKSPLITPYALDGSPLKRSYQARDLGVVLDAKLSFLPHIDATVSKANRMLGLLIRSMQLPKNFSRLNHRSLIAAYNAHIRSVIEYGCIVWSGAAHSHLMRLERLQHKFLIWLAHKSDKPSARTDYTSLLIHFQVQSIKSRFAFYDLMFMHNLFHDRLDAPDLLGAFALNAPARITRTLSLWALPFSRVETVLRSTFRRVPLQCNAFLRACPSVDFFTSTQYSFKKAAIKYSATLGSFM